MEHRQLGRTGVSVSKLCLGAMMFGDWGNKDHDDCIRIIHRALDAGINFIDSADIYSQAAPVGIDGVHFRVRAEGFGLRSASALANAECRLAAAPRAQPGASLGCATLHWRERSN